MESDSCWATLLRIEASASSVDDELDGVWQLFRDVGGYASSEKIGQGVPLGRADHEKIDAHRRRKVENGCGCVFTHGINWQDANVALGPEPQHKRHNCLCFRVILPPGTTAERWSAGVVDRDFFDVKNAQSCFAQLRLVQCKTQNWRDAASCDHNFLAFFQARLHGRGEIW